MTRTGISGVVVVGLVLWTQAPRVEAQGTAAPRNGTSTTAPGTLVGTFPGVSLSTFGGPNAITGFNPYVAAGIASNGLNPYLLNPYYANAYVPRNAANFPGMTMPPPYGYNGYPAAPNAGFNGAGFTPESGVVGNARSDAGVSAVLNGQGKPRATKSSKPARSRTRKTHRR